jgi:hypothetical protein
VIDTGSSPLQGYDLSVGQKHTSYDDIIYSSLLSLCNHLVMKDQPPILF